MNRAICLLSGGQDSTTALYWAKQKFDSVFAVIFDYDQRHKIEIESAKQIAGISNTPCQVISVPFFKEIGNSSLLNDGDVNIPHQINKNLPSSFVPGRNLIFLTIASMIAFKQQCNNVVIGVCQQDYSGYPDCRKYTMESMQESINLGIGIEDFTIWTPLMDLTKAETVKLASSLNGCMNAMTYSHTCYNGEYPPCGKCPSCILRAKGFQEAGIKDPIFER